MSDKYVSHGRGGAANITPDDQTYVDGEIVREGPVGDQDDGAYSAGRGGAGNIGSPMIKPSKTPHDEILIPETAVRKQKEGDHHVGRGGAGNEFHDHKDTHEGLADKLKHKILGKKD